MRNGSLVGLSEIDLDELSPPIMLDGGNAIWLDDYDTPRRFAAEDGPGPTPWWSLTEQERQSRMRAEAERRSNLAQDPGVYDDMLGRNGPDPRDERFLVDGVFDPRANEISKETLKRENRSPGCGGGGGKSGRSRTIVLKKSVHEPPGKEVHGNRYVASVVFRGVTRGQHAVFRDHPSVPGAVEAMLTAVSAAVRRGSAPPAMEQRPKQLIPGTKSIALVVADLDVARHYRDPYMRGVALAILMEVVSRFDAARIARLDANQLQRKGIEIAA